MKSLPSLEWDFSEFKEANPHARSCSEWEYYREVYYRYPAFKKAVKEWRKNRDPKDNDSDLPMLQLLGESVGRFWFVRTQHWPSLPFQDPRVTRPDLSGPLSEEAIEQGSGIQIDLQSLPETKLRWEHWPTGSVLVSEEDLVVALHINFWMHSQEEILEQFKKWLRWAKGNMDRLPKPKSRMGNAMPLKQAQTHLKELTALRLLEGRRYKEALETWGREREDLYSDQSGWINASKAALKRIKVLASEWGEDTPLTK